MKDEHNTKKEEEKRRDIENVNTSKQREETYAADSVIFIS